MANYAIVKLNGSFTVNSETVQGTIFPKVPIQAVTKSINEMDTPVGIPATVIELMGDAASGESLTPTAVGQKYYNTIDKLIYTAVDNDGTIEWGETGAEAADGQLYMMRKGSPQVDTLYVKSVVDNSYFGLVELQLSTATAVPYAGPFTVGYVPLTNNQCKVTVSDPSVAGMVDAQYCGYVFIGATNILRVPAVTVADNIVVNNGAGLFLFVVLNSTTLSTVIGTTTPTSGTVKLVVRLATNNNGRMTQAQYGDVVIGRLA